MIRIARLVAAALVGAGPALAPAGALAQVPPHPPGTICFTPYYWCWAVQPGPVGAPCWCEGGAQGVLG